MFTKERNKFGLSLRRGLMCRAVQHAQCYVHMTAEILMRHGRLVYVWVCVKCLVHKLTFRLCTLLRLCDTTLSNQVAEYNATHINGEARRRVIEGVIVRH